MKSDINILIPARSGSKRILNKNIIDLCGKPLIYYAIKESLKITKSVFVSTDSEEIKAMCQKYDINIIDRPPKLAEDTSSTNSVIYHFLQNKEVDRFALVQATSPLLKAEYLIQGFEKFKTGVYDSIISVYETKDFYWSKEGTPININIKQKQRTQDMQSWFVENGAFYITSRENFTINNNLVNGKVGFAVMPKIDSVDIDEYEDLEIAAAFLKHRENNK